MEYRKMGRTGLKVSEICLGTMTFGHGTDEVESKRIIDAAFDTGVNFFDTANSYGDGNSEVFLGNALRGRRDNAVVATKFFNPMGTGPNDSGISRLHIMQAIESSLHRLKMDHFDLHLGAVHAHPHDRSLPIRPLDLSQGRRQILLFLLTQLHSGHRYISPRRTRHRPVRRP